MQSLAWWRCLPSRSNEVDELASPYTSLQLIAVCRGGGPDQPVLCHLVLLRWCLSGGGSFLGHHYRLMALSSSSTCS
jgi:hypothetical protein